MAKRIDSPSLDNTKKLLSEILLITIGEGDRALFLCESGSGEAILQRLRMMLHRKRRDMERKGKPFKRFKLRSTIHHETHQGKRFDACVLWIESSVVDRMSEELERMLSNG